MGHTKDPGGLDSVAGSARCSPMPAHAACWPRRRYFFHNGTGAPSASATFAGTSLQQLVTISGGGSARGEHAPHATDITLRGIRFADAALSTLAPHGPPAQPALRKGKRDPPCRNGVCGNIVSRKRPRVVCHILSVPRLRLAVGRRGRLGDRALGRRARERCGARHRRGVPVRAPGRQRPHAFWLPPPRFDRRLALGVDGRERDRGLGADGRAQRRRCE